nr:alpha/beta hydrolase [uncultured Psychroserpens sp.]
MILRIVYLYLILVLSLTNLCFGQQNIVSEEILIKNDSIKLPGTLSHDASLVKQPLAIFVHGSGNVDRNGNQAMGPSPNYIKLLNDSLTLKGIAFYRFDKRTATRENLKYVMKDMRFDAFVEDINLVIDKFKDDERFSSITLIGHSQGSLVSMLVNHSHVDKYISLAGPSHTVDHSIIAQVKLQNGDSIATIVKSHFKELSEKGSIERVDPNLMVLFNKPTQPFLVSWMKYNPSEVIKTLKMPILILNGDKDIQVYLEDAEALHKANPKSKKVIIKNMTHTLKTIEKDSDIMATLNSPDFPLSQELVETIAAFIKQ